MSLNADKETVQIGKPVRFTATLSPPFREVFYAFDADGKSIGGGMDQPSVVPRFFTPGPHVVNVHVLFRGTTLTRSSTVQVNEVASGLPPAFRVQLTPDKPRVRVGEAVSFTISTIPDVPNLDYQFNAGDGSPIRHEKTRTIQYTYKKPNNYTAMVAVRGAQGPARAQLAVSADQTGISPASPATPSWRGGRSVPWNYVILIGLLIVIIGCLLYWPKSDRDLKPKPTVLPTFHPHWDDATLQKQPENLRINYELHFDPNVSKARDRLETAGVNLILARKKKT